MNDRRNGLLTFAVSTVSCISLLPLTSCSSGTQLSPAQQAGQEEALARIKQLGGTAKPPEGPVERVNLAGTKVVDDDLKLLAALPGLRILNLSHSQVGDNGLSHLTSAKELVELILSSTQVTNQGVLRLRDLPKLGFLFVKRTQVTDATVEELRKAIPHLMVQNRGAGF